MGKLLGFDLSQESDTRKLLKVFGVSVTDFEDESRRLLARLEGLAQGPTVDAKELAKATLDILEMMVESSVRLMEVTERVHRNQQQFLHQAAEVLRRLA